MEVSNRDAGLIVIAPLGNNPRASAIVSLAKIGGELRTLGADVFFLVDSSVSTKAIDDFRTITTALSSYCNVEIRIADKNAGRIEVTNELLALARSNRQDVILLNSEAEIFGGAFSEMRLVAQADPMIAFVSPLSNRQDTCAMSAVDGFQESGALDGYGAYMRVRPYFKQFGYTPAASDAALYIKWKVLEEFGLLDPEYSPGAESLDDLVMRANRCGYRAAIANHAYVHLADEQDCEHAASFQSTKQSNSVILNTRYPEYERALETYCSSESARAMQLLQGLVPNARGVFRVGFDLTNFELFHNGTFEAARKILAATVEAGRGKYEFAALCRSDVFAFHRLEAVQGLTQLPPETASPFAAVIRIGPFFESDDLARARMRGTALVTMMLDPIAVDCAYMATAGLHDLWQKTLDASDVVTFISNFTMQQFRLRFSFPEDADLVPLLLSTDASEYRHNGAKGHVSDDEKYLLVVGNDLSHKFLAEVAKKLESHTLQKNVIVFGVSGSEREKIKYIPSGELSDTETLALYAGATGILFPSHYEGFGFPVMNALAMSKPVFVRDLPVFREIAAHCPEGSNIHFFDTTDEMIEAAISGPISWDATPRHMVRPRIWADSGEALLSAIERHLPRVTQKKLEQKIRTLNLAPAMLNSATLRRTMKIEAALLAMGRPGIVDRLLRKIPGKFADRRLLATSPLFDTNWYRSTYKDVAANGSDPIKHYLQSGWLEGRNPSESFDTKFYLKQHQDVRASAVNPLLHYIRHGIPERRVIRSLAGNEIVIHT